MSLPEAKAVLGFPPTANPSAEEISKAYKAKVFENHPDKGGDPKKMVDVNVAKDILDGKSRATWVPEPAPRRERPKPVEPDAVMEGQDFAKAWANSGAPANTDWKFVSIPEYYWPSSSHPGHQVWVLYGQTDQKHIFLAFKKRAEGAGTMPTDMGERTKIMEDWQSSMVDVPRSQDLVKVVPKYLRQIGTAWTDAKPKPPRKFVMWPGGKPTEHILQKIPRAGGVGLKDILLGAGLLSDGDPSAAGRKSVVEVFTKTSLERLNRMKALKAEGKLKSLNVSHYYDFFVRVNGKTEQLSDDTIEKMERRFIPWVMGWDNIGEGRAKNLTRMRPGRLKYDAGASIRELANCLTSEPSWLHIALEKAAEEYETEESAKTAAKVAARFQMGATTDPDANQFRDMAIKAIKRVGDGVRAMGLGSVVKFNPQERVDDDDRAIHARFTLRFDHSKVNSAYRPAIFFYWDKSKGLGYVESSSLVWKNKHYDNIPLDKMGAAMLDAAGDILADIKRQLGEPESKEAWSLVTLGKGHGYAAEVQVFSSKAKAEKEAQEQGNCYVVKGTQMWNEPLGQVEEHDHTAPSKFFP
jgi:hypothetical protein